MYYHAFPKVQLYFISASPYYIIRDFLKILDFFLKNKTGVCTIPRLPLSLNLVFENKDS